MSRQITILLKSKVLSITYQLTYESYCMLSYEHVVFDSVIINLLGIERELLSEQWTALCQT